MRLILRKRARLNALNLDRPREGSMTGTKLGAAAMAAATLTLGAAYSRPPGFRNAIMGAGTGSGTEDWAVYGGQAAQNHYSSLSQINRKNVRNLRVAWIFDTGEKE